MNGQKLRTDEGNPAAYSLMLVYRIVDLNQLISLCFSSHIIPSSRLSQKCVR
jgi:hypothetical protein